MIKENQTGRIAYNDKKTESLHEIINWSFHGRFLAHNPSSIPVFRNLSPRGDHRLSGRIITKQSRLRIPSDILDLKRIFWSIKQSGGTRNFPQFLTYKFRAIC